MKIAALLLLTVFSFNSSPIFAQSCTLTCPDNLILSASGGQEGTVVNFPAYKAPADCGTLTFTPASGSFFRLGSHSIIVTSSSGQKCSFTVTITDNEAPVLSPVTLTRTRLWPASDKWKKVGLNYTVKDNGENVKTIVTVHSNAIDGIDDYEIVDERNLRLKSSRLRDGSPRVFTITVTATDQSGNKTVRTTTIAVSETITAKPLPE